MTPEFKADLTIAFVTAVHIIRRQFDALYLLFDSHEGRGGQLVMTAPHLSDAAALAFTVMVYMSIAKLFDPPHSMNDPTNRNLVLRTVIDAVGGKPGTPERQGLEAEYRKLKPTVAKMKEWRHKFGAHSDLSKAIAIVHHSRGNDETPHPAPYIPIAEVKAAVLSLTAITDVLVKMHAPTIADWYGNPIAPEVERLAAVLERALE